MTTVDHSAPDATELDGDRPVIRPGDLLNVYEYQEIRHEFAAGAGLRPDQVLMTPYGYPPLPRPPAGGADGTGRLPADLAPEMAGHPVFWLDGPTRRQRDGELDDAYAIRLFLELVDRGHLDGESGRLRNPLVALGIDVRDDADRDRLAAYRDGGWDAGLCGLVVAPNPDTPPGALAAEAARAHRAHAEAYRDLIALYRRTVANAVADARATVRSADLDADSRRLTVACEDLRRAAAAGDDPRSRRVALDEAYRWLLARMAQLDGARAVLAVEIDRQTHLDAPKGAAAYAAEVERAHAGRCAALEPPMAAVYADPADEIRLRALLLAARGAYQDALDRARTVLALADRVVVEEPLATLPPADTPGADGRRADRRAATADTLARPPVRAGRGWRAS
jgi:hypothetical protein